MDHPEKTAQPSEVVYPGDSNIVTEDSKLPVPSPDHVTVEANSQTPLAVGRSEETCSSEESTPQKMSTAHQEDLTSSYSSEKSASSEEIEPAKLQEFETLNYIINQIPTKAQRGLFTSDLHLTSLDVTCEYIALGTNLGLVFMYDRMRQMYQRLSCQNRSDIITCISMQSSLEYVVAMGTSSGLVCIFQLPSILPGRTKLLQMISVRDMHKSAVSCLQWSQNTMKLFSGDESGLVVCTEMDYSKNTSESYFVIQELHKVVQLSYAHKKLLVSTLEKSFLLSTDKKPEQFAQVGTKERKSMGAYGASFIPDLCKPLDTYLYASRPGLRLWKADAGGKVSATYIYKDLLKQSTSVIPLLPDTVPKTESNRADDKQFGLIYHFGKTGLVLTHSGTAIFLLNPIEGTVVGYHGNIGEIINISTCEHEVFILRKTTLKNRPLIRLGVQPDALLSLERIKYFENCNKAMSESEASKSSDSGQRSPLHNLTDSIKDKLKTVGGRITEAAASDWLTISGQDREQMEEMDRQSHTFIPPITGIGSAFSVFKFKKQKQHDIATNEPVTEKSDTSEELPPVVKLESDDLLTVTINSSLDASSGSQTDNACLERTREIVSSSVSNSKNMTSVLGTVEREGYSSSSISVTTDFFGAKGMKSQKVTILDADSKTDIVYTGKAKKTKKKKQRQVAVGKEVEADNVSVGETEGSTAGSDSSSVTSLNASPTMQPTVQPNNEQNQQLTQSSSRMAQVETVSYPMDHIQNQAVSQTEIAQGLKAETPPPSYDKITRNLLPEGSPKKASEVVSKEQPDSSDASISANNKSSKDTLTKLEVKTNSSSNICDKSKASPVVDETFQINNKTSAKDISSENDDFIDNISTVNDGPQTKPPGTPKVRLEEKHMLKLESATSDPLMNVETALPTEPFMDKESISPTETLGSMYKSPDTSGEDIYTKYRRSSSTISPVSSQKVEQSLEDNLDYSAAKELHPKSGTVGKKDKQLKMYDSWSEFLAPGSVQSLCVADRNVWCTDKHDHLYYSNLVGPGLKWQKVEEPAKQISVSTSGSIIWRLYKGSVYACSNSTVRSMQSMKWVEVVRDVAFIAVDDNLAWYIKNNGDILLQKGLTRERPSFRSYKVPCPFKLIQICCFRSVVWGLTEDRKVIIRLGVEPSCPEGTGWKYMEGGAMDLLASSICLGDRSTGWLIDVVDRVWFTKDVTMTTPEGDGKWYQISLSEYLMQDASALDTLRSITGGTLSRFIYSDKLQPGLINVSKNGVWVCPGCRNVIHVCRGSLTGNRWEKGIPLGMAVSTRWNSVIATLVDTSFRCVWAQSQGEIIVISASSLRATPVELPDPQCVRPIIAVTEEAVWALSSDGRVHIRTGLRPSCPQGVSWVQLDLQQICNAKLVDISCSNQNVWAVDSKGRVYLRIGVRAPSSSYLNPAWVPVDGSPNNHAIFTNIFTGSSDTMVWAIDSRNCVYVRQGVTESMPIGTDWLYVQGTPAINICVSSTTVYALNLCGEVMCRFGVSEKNVAGDYWKKIPGVFSKISVSDNDELWAINNEDQLVRRQVEPLSRPQVLQDLATNQGSQDLADDWEMI